MVFLIILLVLHFLLILLELIVFNKLKSQKRFHTARMVLIQFIPIIGPIIGVLVAYFVYYEDKMLDDLKR